MTPRPSFRKLHGAQVPILAAGRCYGLSMAMVRRKAVSSATRALRCRCRAQDVGMLAAGVPIGGARYARDVAHERLSAHLLAHSSALACQSTHDANAHLALAA
eukprot:2781940-Prymnesium_polylepis.1